MNNVREFVFKKDYEPTIWVGDGQIMRHPGTIKAGTVAIKNGFSLAVNKEDGDVLFIAMVEDDVMEYLEEVKQ